MISSDHIPPALEFALETALESMRVSAAVGYSMTELTTPEAIY